MLRTGRVSVTSGSDRFNTTGRLGLLVNICTLRAREL